MHQTVGFGMPVRLDQLTKRFDAAVAVDRVSLTIQPGELLTVAGPRGSGKSTLLRLLAGLDEPSSGTIHAGDRELAAGAVADRPIAFGSLDAGGGSGEAGERFTSSEACVLLDEPLASLSGAPRAAGRDRLRVLPAALGAAVVCAMGDEDEDEADARAVSDRIAVLREGRLRQCGTLAEVMDTPADEFVAAFFGRPRINLVPGILEKDGQAIQLGNQTVSLAGRIEETFCRDITLGIRPGHVGLTRDGVGLRGRVHSSEAFDGRMLVRVAVEGVTVRALDGGRDPLRAGDAVRVRVDSQHYVVFDDQGVRLDQR